MKVQLAILTAVVKLFIRKSDATKDLVTKILKLATEEVDNPDLRDRGFMYWRLLSTNAAAAQDIVLSDKPPISTETDRMDRGSLDQLLLHAGTLGSIYHKSPEVRHHHAVSLVLRFPIHFRFQTFIRTARGKQLPESPALNAASRTTLLRLPGSTSYQAPALPEYRPTGGVTTDMGADAGGGAGGDDADSPDQEESLLGGGGGGSADDGQGQEFSPISPAAQNGASTAVGGPATLGSVSTQIQPQVPHDPYANLDGLFVTDAPQPLSAPGGGRGLGGQHDDLLF